MILFTAKVSALGSMATKLLAAITVGVVKSTMDGAQQLKFEIVFRVGICKRFWRAKILEFGFETGF
jgi:hypothetical protein